MFALYVSYYFEKKNTPKTKNHARKEDTPPPPPIVSQNIGFYVLLVTLQHLFGSYWFPYMCLALFDEAASCEWIFNF